MPLFIPDPFAAKMTLNFAYDYYGRRVSKVVSNYVSGSYAFLSNTRFVYDGLNLIDELNGTNNAVIRAYMWGTDLSGTRQGAGGVGGLLVIAGTNPQFTCFDGNANISALVDTTSSAVTGQYEYGPFGEVIRATGPMAKANPFRLSTKYQDDETDFDYYGYRYLNTSTGRWLSRDPLGEHASRNLYGVVRNAPVLFIDYLGEFTWFSDPPVWSQGTTIHGDPLGTDGTFVFLPENLAATWPGLSIKAPCVLCAGAYKLAKQGVIIHFDVSVIVRPGLPTAENDFAKQHEPEHVQDFENWANKTGEPLAESLEAYFRQQSWSSQSSCEKDIMDTFRTLLDDSLQQAIEQTKATWDDSGKHTFYPK